MTFYVTIIPKIFPAYGDKSVYYWKDSSISINHKVLLGLLLNG